MDKNPDEDKPKSDESTSKNTRASSRTDGGTTRKTGVSHPKMQAVTEDDKPKPGKSWIRKLIPLIIIIAVLAIAYYVWASTRVEGYGPGFAGGNGRLEATEIDIATKLAGRIIEIHVDEGDGIQAGQELAVMQLNVLEAQRNEAVAQVGKARASVASARANVAVKASDANAAQATVAQRESELDQTRRRLERSSVLSQKGVITGQQFDDDETTEMAAKAAVESAKAQVQVAQAAVAAAQADALGAAATVKAAEATVASIEADITDSHLKAPRNGRVQYRIVQPGEVLAAGGKVLNFVDLSDDYMNFFLPSEQAGKVRLGSEARILLDAFPDLPIPAHITYVAKTAQFTPKTVETESERQKLMFRVKAKIDAKVLAGREEYVKPGLPGVTWVRLDDSQPWPEAFTVRRSLRDPLAPSTGAASPSTENAAQ